MKRIVWVAGVLLVALAVVLGTLWLTKPELFPGGGKPSVPVRHRLARGPISHGQVLEALYGKAGKDGRLELPNSQVASVWAQVSFRIGAVERVAVLVAEEDDGGECHACPAILGATVYRKTDQGWVLESKAKEVGKVGSFGEAGSPEGLEARPIGSGKAVLLVPSTHTAQGISQVGDELLVYAPPHWLDAGYIQLGGDNSGQCSDDPKERKAEQLDRCWTETGKLNFVAGANPEYEDVRVARSGTTEGGPATNAAYAFDGKQYREKKSP